MFIRFLKKVANSSENTPSLHYEIPVPLHKFGLKVLFTFKRMQNVRKTNLFIQELDCVEQFKYGNSMNNSYRQLV